MLKALFILAISVFELSAQAGVPSAITVRTENYARPPYSGATYYIYEQNGKVICTKLQVCNKFDDCETNYYKGSFKDSEDIEAGEPFATTAAQLIAPAKLSKHRCLTKFNLLVP